MRWKAAKVLEAADKKMEVKKIEMEMEIEMEDESGTQGEEGDGSRIERSWQCRCR